MADPAAASMVLVSPGDPGRQRGRWPEISPNITLTLQSTLAGTILADGTTVAAPGVPLIVKLENGEAVPSETVGTNPTAAIGNSFQGGAGFLVGVDNGVDPTADSLVDPGAFSQLRILGIAGNQTTGQTRVPVIITSIHDSSVGTTVNNVKMNQVIPGDTKTPAAGDGGVIYFGGNSLTDYDLLDPRDGNVIDNANISYITRIEQQGGGIIYGYDLTNSNAYTPSDQVKFGIPITVQTPTGPQTIFGDQYNQPKQLTISDSNLSSFSDAGFVAHPGYGAIVDAQNYPQMPNPARNAAVEASRPTPTSSTTRSPTCRSARRSSPRRPTTRPIPARPRRCSSTTPSTTTGPASTPSPRCSTVSTASRKCQRWRWMTSSPTSAAPRSSWTARITAPRSSTTSSSRLERTSGSPPMQSTTTSRSSATPNSATRRPATSSSCRPRPPSTSPGASSGRRSSATCSTRPSRSTRANLAAIPIRNEPVPLGGGGRQGLWRCQPTRPSRRATSTPMAGSGVGLPAVS